MIGLQGQHVRIIRSDEELRVRRTTSSPLKDGKFEHYDFIEFQIKCNVQPVNGRDLLLVPEGDRYKEQYWVWVENPNPPSSILETNDQVMRAGGRFQIQSLENWGKYLRIRMMRVDIGPERTP